MTENTQQNMEHPLILEGQVELAEENVTTEEIGADWNNLFEDDHVVPQAGGNQLTHTATLTQIATDIANEVFGKASADKEAYGLKIQASQQSHDAMDDLINECYNLGSVDVDFLKELDEDKIDRMIRSQQSKRSRAKSKTMTRDNYLTMMVGAVAENILRIAGDKPKTSGGSYSSSAGYTEEDLEVLAQYPEDLTRAIRNVQSKKSIMRSKADFDPQSPRWMQLLQTEEQLKALRDDQKSSASVEAREALARQQKLSEMLEDVSNVNPEQAAEMLESIKAMIANN